MFTNVYSAVVYYYFFEAFLFLYGSIYGFSIGEIDFVFICAVNGYILAMAICSAYLHFGLISAIAPNDLHLPEWRLRISLITILGSPVGLLYLLIYYGLESPFCSRFSFKRSNEIGAWTANTHIG